MMRKPNSSIRTARAAAQALFILFSVSFHGAVSAQVEQDMKLNVPAKTAATRAMGCGTATSTGSGNVAPLVVDGFPCAAAGTAGAVNFAEVPYTSVEICAPGSRSNCQIIDHVIVDTGSTGLRFAAKALKASLQPGKGLPLAAGSVAGTGLTECETYVDSYVYGPLVTADVYIAGKRVSASHLQVFGDSSYTVPKDCSSQGGTETDSIQSFAGNGLIGVSFALTDAGIYYDCKTPSGTSCSVNSRYAGLPNTVSQFSSDNNGVLLSLPALPAAGSNSPVVGSLIFGVATQSNNTPAETTLAVANDVTQGTFSTKVGNQWFSAYIDSGTDVVYFNDRTDTALTACPSSGNFNWLYCPRVVQHIPFMLADSGSTVGKGSLTYSVASATRIVTQSAVAYADVAGPDTSSATVGSSIGFGLSSFFGHRMYFLFNGKTAPGTGLGGSASSTARGPINGID